MRGMLLIQSVMVLTVGAWAGEPAAPAKSGNTQQGVKTVGTESKSEKKVEMREVAVGEVVSIELACNPTTGYNWELKSIDKKIAEPIGPVEFKEAPAKPGMMGVGGKCVLGIKGVKKGKTKAVMVYRRSWEKGEPAETFTAEIKVVAKKKS
jgi:inhibitor of cysteine peptidase